MSSSPSTTSQSPVHQNVVPSEVGWQFVPQYYTFVNKQPNRLHCFYTKNSTFIHGTEGEDGRPCFGQQEIHNKILSIGFQDCKVFIHSVDAQASSHGGIIIQVIGEMSNRGEAWRKFVQTFFLAEQPNGYFVLNDIFRFLKEESVDSEEEGVEPVPEPDHVSIPAPVDHSGNVTVEATTQAPAPVENAPEPAASLPEPVVVPVPVEESKPQLNGFHTPEQEKHVELEQTPTESVAEQIPVAEPVQEDIETVAPAPVHEPAPAPVTQVPSAPSPAPPAQAPAPVQVRNASPAPVPQQPVQAPPPPQSQHTAAPAQQAPAPTPSAPPAPKTWANLAAANPKKWGAAVAQDSKGTSEAVAPSPPGSGTQTPVRTTSTAQQSQGGGQQSRENHPAYIAATSITTAQCFVKGVIETISNTQLTQTLTQRFGTIKEVDVVRLKACAFVEFHSVDAAKRAIVASLPVPHGGEGGVRVETADGGSVKIIVETRKERGERPAPRPRGGAPSNGTDGRGGPGGSFRGRGGGRGGRGGGGGGPGGAGGK